MRIFFGYSFCKSAQDLLSSRSVVYKLCFNDCLEVFSLLSLAESRSALRLMPFTSVSILLPLLSPDNLKHSNITEQCWAVLSVNHNPRMLCKTRLQPLWLCCCPMQLAAVSCCALVQLYCRASLSLRWIIFLFLKYIYIYIFKIFLFP